MTARRFRGPNGAVFSPSAPVSDSTIARFVERGEWVPVEEPAPAVPDLSETEDAPKTKPRRGRKPKTEAAS